MASIALLGTGLLGAFTTFSSFARDAVTLAEESRWVPATAYLASTLSELHQDVSGRLAGLLDCRRKASHRNRPAEGTITLDVQMRDGKIARVSTKENGVNDRSAPQCVSKWLSKSDVRSNETAANVELAVTFSR